MSSNSKTKNPKPGNMSPDQRKKRTQQIIFSILSVIIIISWIAALLVNF